MFRNFIYGTESIRRYRSLRHKQQVASGPDEPGSTPDQDGCLSRHAAWMSGTAPNAPLRYAALNERILPSPLSSARE